jgi:3-isopropylmalate dehydrogenase
MDLDIAVLSGDGIGPEVIGEAVKVLKVAGEKFGHTIHMKQGLIGGAALDLTGNPLPEETLDDCLKSKAVLLGAVGGPAYENNPRGLKPEDGLLGLRRGLGAFANLRPVVVYDELIDASPLKAETVRGCDLLIVRELLGGLYYGEPRGMHPDRAINSMVYTAGEVERIARVAFDAARLRRRRVTSVDKANVLEVSQFWRDIVTRVAKDYPDIQVEHALVDSCAMQLVQTPGRFDVILSENMFGDILSDEAAVIAGSIGVLASASLGGTVGLYEPVHGSAPDIAGQGIANPLGAILSAALMLRYSFRLEQEAQSVEGAVRQVLANGLRTPDLAANGESTTEEMGEAVCGAL